MWSLAILRFRGQLRAVNILQAPPVEAWIAVAMGDFDALLIDHAHCEQKAAASAMTLVAQYPGHDVLVRRLSALAEEELRHFRAVHKLIVARGLHLTRDTGDPYAQKLIRHVRTSDRERRLDRLLVSSLIEARSSERLEIIAQALPPGELHDFYDGLATAERGHFRLFVDIAKEYEEEPVVLARLQELASVEADIMRELPIAPRMH